LLKPFYQTALTEAGCDEAGRGCLAGPVFAAAVILPKDFYHLLLNDSKQVTEKHRNLLRRIIEAEAIAYSVASIDNTEIDRINILKPLSSAEGPQKAATLHASALQHSPFGKDNGPRDHAEGQQDQQHGLGD
jgi:ribonuclease HII